MTGYDIYEKAMQFIGMGDTDGEIPDGTAILPAALEAINQIGFDLCGMQPKATLFDVVDLPAYALAAMPYGVGMLLSMSIGVTQQNALMTELYNAKRATVKAATSRVRDRLPVTEVDM